METLLRLKKNKKFWEKYFIREKVIQAIREFFINKGFHEVETPLLVSSVIPESYLDVFETYLKGKKGEKCRMFLATSPEASIKKLLVAGLGNCFEITKSFRKGETGSKLHNPEFTILEWYRVGAAYKDIMKDCEELMMYINRKITPPVGGGSRSGGTMQNSKINKIIYQSKKIDLTPPWERISIQEALEKYTRVSFDKITEKAEADENRMFPVEKIAKMAKKKGYHVEEENTWEEIFNQIFLNEIEPHLGTHGRPTIIYDYPLPLSALAKIKSSDSRLVERFEFYIGGLELGDCYTELTDYEEQKKRFKEELEKIKKGGKISVIPDEDFLQALKEGLPSCSGVAVGVDRLVMLFTNSKTIQETSPFPFKYPF